MAQHIDNKGVTIVELILVIVAFLLIIGALTPFVEMARERSLRLNCAKNIRKISLGLHSYAAGHNDAFPVTLGELYPDYIETESVFDCPAVKGTGIKDKPDYRYVSGLTEYSSPKEIAVEDLDGNHKKRGRNILRLDGSVEWVPAPR